MRRTRIVWPAAFLLLVVSYALARKPQTENSKPQLPKDHSFTIDAHRPWNDTGLDLHPGELVHIYAGVVACGAPAPGEKYALPLPSAPAGTLLVKLHAEADPVLASPDAEFPIMHPSHLLLGVNGTHCTGTISVSVHVGTQPAGSTSK
jgi:hypothetical protein